MSAHYFEVIKTCFLLCIISIYCSLYICFNCSWNFVSLWLWVALDLSFFFSFFFSWNFVGLMLWVALVLSFFFLCRFPRFLLLPLLSNLWQRKIMKLDFLFPFFFLVMQFLLDFWFPRILLFDFNFGFVLV